MHYRDYVSTQSTICDCGAFESRNRKKKVVFQQNNAPCHKSLDTMIKLHELFFELFSYRLYSQDLGRSDY